MTNVGLGGAEVEGAVLGSRGAKDLHERAGLDGVAEVGAGAVGLDVINVVGLQAGAVKGLLDDPLLGRAVGGGEALAAAVLIHRGAAHHREDGVAVPLGVRETLEHQHADTLRPDGAVGLGREALAATGGGLGAESAHLYEDGRGGHGLHAAGEGEVGLAVAQGGAGEMQGHKGRRARGVHGEGRAL